MKDNTAFECRGPQYTNSQRPLTSVLFLIPCSRNVRAMRHLKSAKPNELVFLRARRAPTMLFCHGTSLAIALFLPLNRVANLTGKSDSSLMASGRKLFEKMNFIPFDVNWEVWFILQVFFLKLYLYKASVLSRIETSVVPDISTFLR